MLALTPHLKIFVAFDPIDFRCGMNRLAQIAKDLFAEDPQSGVLFVFRNRRQSEVKILVYDGSGYYLIHRRLSSDRLGFWPKTLLQQKEPGITVESSDVEYLLKILALFSTLRQLLHKRSLGLLTLLRRMFGVKSEPHKTSEDEQSREKSEPVSSLTIG